MSAVELYPPSLDGEGTSAAQGGMFTSQPVVFPGMPGPGQKRYAPSSESGQVACSPAGVESNSGQSCPTPKQEEHWKQCRYSVPASENTAKTNYQYNPSGGGECQVSDQVGISARLLCQSSEKSAKLEAEMASGGGSSAAQVSGLAASQAHLCANTKHASHNMNALANTTQAPISLPLPPFGVVPFVNSMQWNAGLDSKLPFGMIALQGASNINLPYPINLGAPSMADPAVQAAQGLHKPGLTPTSGVEASGWVGIPSTEALTLATTAASSSQGLDLRGAKDAASFLGSLNSPSAGQDPSTPATGKKKRSKSGGGGSHSSHNPKIPRKHRCMKCEYQTDNRSHLKRHENSVHSEVKPYMCYVCSKEFSRTEKIRAHFQRFHPSVDYEPSLVYRHRSPPPSPKPSVVPAAERNSGGSSAIPDTRCHNHPCCTATTLLSAGLATSLTPSIPHLSSVTMFPGMPELSSLGVPTVMGMGMASNSHMPLVSLAPTTSSSLHCASSGLSSMTSTNHDGMLSAAPATAAESNSSPSKSQPAKFKCHLCTYMGKDSWHLRRHMSDVHEKIKEFQCPRCTYETSRKHRIISHMKSHGELYCFYCNYKTANLEPYMSHLKQCTKEHRSAFPCSQCKEHFASQKSLLSHQEREHSGAAYTCESCALPCENAVALELHKQKHTPQVAPGQQCGLCGDSFSSVELLQEHMRQNHAGLSSTHDKECLACTVCHFRTHSHLVLQSHLQLHSSELSQLADRAAPWKCHTPGPMGSSPARLTGDQQTCPVCFRAFSSQQALQDHLPEHSAEFICRMCGNVYTQQEQLEAHKDHCKMKVSPRAMPHNASYSPAQKDPVAQSTCPQEANSTRVHEDDQKVLKLGKKVASNEDYMSAFLRAGIPTSVENTRDHNVSGLVTSSVSSLHLPPASPMQMDRRLSAPMTSSYSSTMLLTSPSSSYAQSAMTTYSTSQNPSSSDFTLLGQPPSSNASSLPSTQVLI